MCVSDGNNDTHGSNPSHKWAVHPHLIAFFVKKCKWVKNENERGVKAKGKGLSQRPSSSLPFSRGVRQGAEVEIHQHPSAVVLAGLGRSRTEVWTPQSSAAARHRSAHPHTEVWRHDSSSFPKKITSRGS